MTNLVVMFYKRIGETLEILCFFLVWIQVILLIIGKVCQIVDITKLKRNRNPDLEAEKENLKKNNDNNNKDTYLGGDSNHKACKKRNLALVEGFGDGNNPHSKSITAPKGTTRVREDGDENMFFHIERAWV